MADSPSNNAIRLLSVLRERHADCRERALTDARLAHLADMHPRLVIVAADELLAAGYPACAAGPGRWLGNIEDIAAYCDSLDKRARNIFIRRQHVLAVRDKMQRGQLPLFKGA